jgi:hypothetical protein
MALRLLGGLPDGGLPDGLLPDGLLPDGLLPDGGLRQRRHKRVLFRHTSDGTVGTWDAHRVLLGPTLGEKPVVETDFSPRVGLSVTEG